MGNENTKLCENYRDGLIGSALGMTLRDFFAAKAMHAIITEPTYEGAQSFFMYFKKRLGLKGEGMDEYAQVAYAMADAMLRAREASNG